VVHGPAKQLPGTGINKIIALKKDHLIEEDQCVNIAVLMEGVSIS
jgi:hypothetical protein